MICLNLEGIAHPAPLAPKALQELQLERGGTYLGDKKGDFAVLIIEVERKERNLLRLDDSFLLYYAWQAQCQIVIFGFIHFKNKSPLLDF